MSIAKLQAAAAANCTDTYVKVPAADVLAACIEAGTLPALGSVHWLALEAVKRCDDAPMLLHREKHLAPFLVPAARTT